MYTRRASLQCTCTTQTVTLRQNCKGCVVSGSSWFVNVHSDNFNQKACKRSHKFANCLPNSRSSWWWCWVSLQTKVFVASHSFVIHSRVIIVSEDEIYFRSILSMLALLGQPVEIVSQEVSFKREDRLRQWWKKKSSFSTKGFKFAWEEEVRSPSHGGCLHDNMSNVFLCCRIMSEVSREDANHGKNNDRAKCWMM